MELLMFILDGLPLEDQEYIKEDLKKGKITDVDRAATILTNYLFNTLIKNENKADKALGYLNILKNTYIQYLSLEKCITFDGEYKVHHLNVYDEGLKYFKEYLKSVCLEYLNGRIKFLDLVSIKTEKLENDITDYENKLLASKVCPFHGDEKFMKHRIIYSASKIMDILNTDIPSDIKDKFQNYLEILDDYITNFRVLKVEGDFDYQLKVYDILESYYKELLVIEDTLSPYIENIWNERLLSDRFCGLAHGFSADEFLPDEADKVCTTYFDERYITIYGNYGYLYPMDMSKCYTMCSEDANSDWISKEDFILGIKNWPFYPKIESAYNYFNPLPFYSGNEQTMNYNNPNCSKLLTPDIVLKENYEHALERKMINKNKMPFGFGYNEIIFIGKIKPIGIWVKKDNSNCFYEKALTLSKKTNLPLMVIDVKKLIEDYQISEKDKTVVDKQHKI